jgi:hypothetical protein
VGDHPAFRADVKRISQLTRADLSDRAVVVLDDAGLPTAESARLLQAFVAGGGGLIVALGERSGGGNFSAEARALLPAAAGTIVDRASASGGKLTRLDYSHPVFELFSAPRSGDFSGARFFRYRRLEVQEDSTAETVRGSDGQTGRAGDDRPTVQPSNRPTVLASFDDGSPALVEAKHGKGTVLVWASTLDNYWSDLAVQAVFLPFVHQLAKHASGYSEAAAWFTVGQSVDVAEGRIGGWADSAAGSRTDLVAVAPSGARTVLPAGTGPRVLTLTEQGFYEVRRPGSTVPYRVVAANLDLAESDFTPLDPAELAAAIETPGPGLATGGAVQLAPEERERPQSLWWYLLLAALVVLAAETVVGNQLSRRAAT